MRTLAQHDPTDTLEIVGARAQVIRRVQLASFSGITEEDGSTSTLVLSASSAFPLSGATSSPRQKTVSSNTGGGSRHTGISTAKASKSSRRSQIGATALAPHVVPREISSGNSRTDEIGFLGEYYVFCYLKDKLPDFAEANWTSALCAHAGIAKLASDIGADFFYHDREHVLTECVFGEGSSDKLDDALEYLIEVKATVNSCDAPFHMSAAQLDLARSLTRGSRTDSDVPTKRVLLLFRVYDLYSQPKIKVVPDPLARLSDGQLKIISDAAIQIDLV